MTFAELRQKLSPEGLTVTPWRVQHGIWVGRIPPVPKNGSGDRDYQQEHVDAIRRLLRNPPRHGRPNGDAKAPSCASDAPDGA